MRHRPHQRIESSLRHPIEVLVLSLGINAVGGRKDDRAAPAFEQFRHRQAGADQAAPQVHGHRLVEQRNVGVDDVAIDSRETGVSYVLMNQIDTAVPGRCFGYHTGDLLLAADVTRHGDGLPARTADRFANGMSAITTLAPPAARRSAVRAPIPRAPPKQIATLPLKLLIPAFPFPNSHPTLLPARHPGALAIMQLSRAWPPPRYCTGEATCEAWRTSKSSIFGAARLC